MQPHPGAIGGGQSSREGAYNAREGRNSGEGAYDARGFVHCRHGRQAGV